MSTVSNNAAWYFRESHVNAVRYKSVHQYSANKVLYKLSDTRSPFLKQYFFGKSSILFYFDTVRLKIHTDAFLAVTNYSHFATAFFPFHCGIATLPSMASSRIALVYRSSCLAQRYKLFLWNTCWTGRGYGWMRFNPPNSSLPTPLPHFLSNLPQFFLSTLSQPQPPQVKRREIDGKKEKKNQNLSPARASSMPAHLDIRNSLLLRKYMDFNKMWSFLVLILEG